MPKPTRPAQRKAPQTSAELAARAGVGLEALVRVRFSSTRGWVSNDGGPVWTASLGGWTGYGIAYSEYDIAWKFLRMIGAA